MPCPPQDILQRLGWVLELLHMRQVTTGFDRIDETRWRLATPLQERLHRRQAVKRIIDLHRIELLCVIGEPALHGKVGRIKEPAPVRVDPPRSTDAKLAALCHDRFPACLGRALSNPASGSGFGFAKRRKSVWRLNARGSS